MNDVTTQWVIPTITNLIAAGIIWAAGKGISKTKAAATTLAAQRPSNNTVKGVANTATKRIMVTILSALPYVLVFWFFVTQLRVLLTPDSPPSRLEVFMITFWTFWLLMVFLRLLAGRPVFSGEDKTI